MGPVKAKLQAKYDYLKDDKIEVNFVEFTFGLGPFKISKVSFMACIQEGVIFRKRA